MRGDTPATETDAICDGLDPIEIDARLSELETEIARLRARYRGRGEDGAATSDGHGSVVTRRGVLGAGGILGLLGLGAANASADPRGSVGTSTSPVEKLYAEELNGGVTGDGELTVLAEVDSFSVFAVVEVAQTSPATPDRTPTERLTTSRPSATERTDTSTRTETPDGLTGFGPLAAIAALVLAVVTVRRRRG